MLIWPLENDEVLLWQGRPAPRCYLFRHWRSQLVACATLLFLGTFLWQAFQREALSALWFFFMLPMLPALVFGPLRLAYLRRHWETLFYAVSDRRLLVQWGRKKQTVSYSWLMLETIVVHPYTDQLADIELNFTDSRRVLLKCLEEPKTCLRVVSGLAANPLEQQDPV